MNNEINKDCVDYLDKAIEYINKVIYKKENTMIVNDIKDAKQELQRIQEIFIRWSNQD